MKKITISFLSVFLAVLTALSGIMSVMAYAYEESSVTGGDSTSAIAEIVSSDMSIKSTEDNLAGYYPAADWEAAYPNGLFVVEYSTYELAEGGTDPENPEDVYLGVVVHRIGGCDFSSVVTYSLTCAIGDGEMYPATIGEIYFAPQQESATAKIRIKNDDVRKGNQMLLFMLEEATYGEISAAATAGIKIFDDEPFVPSKITMAAKTAVSDMADGNVTVVVSREDGIYEFCTVHISTKNGTAKAGKDYKEIDEEVVFYAGQQSQEITIPLIQSDTKFDEAKNFTLTMSDPKGGEISGEETIRLNITNKKENAATALTPVDNMTADVKLAGDEDAVIDSASSLMNINDNADRADLLRTAIGSVNGTAVQTLNDSVFTSSGSTSSWTDVLEIGPESFSQRYTSYNVGWTPGVEYTFGNEDLFISSNHEYNLNHFSGIRAYVKNVNKRDLLGNPNTIFGYLEAGGNSDRNKWPGYVNADVFGGSELQWMKNKDLYILKDFNNTNIDYLSSPFALSFEDSTGERVFGSAGYEGKDMKLFYMLYDDELWDDNNFTLNRTELVRTVIPFSVFDTSEGSGMTDFKVNINDSKLNESTITFTTGGYSWTVTVDTAKGGGIGVADAGAKSDMDKYGFFVGSNIVVTGHYSGLSSNMSNPEYLYLRQADGTIHNAAVNGSAGDVVFNLTFETMMEPDTDKLVNDYGFSFTQANNHVRYTLNGDTCINSSYDISKKLTFDVAFSYKQNITINFANVPTLKNPLKSASGVLETEAQHQERVYNAIKDIVKFYDVNDREISVELEVDVDENKCTAYFAPAEFAYLIADPAKTNTGAGAKYRLVTNLYEVDYQELTESTRIDFEICSQVHAGLSLTLVDENTTYIDPTIKVSRTTVAKKNGDDFQTVYTATNIDDYVPYEMLYHDSTANPAITYYAVNFVVSDIYVGKNTGARKDYNVNVYYQLMSGGTNEKLFTFTFKGGADFAEASDVELRDLNTRFTNVDSSENPLADAAAFKPFIKLINYSTAGYEYVLYIPTYYNYQNPQSELSLDYDYLFKGNDGIGFEITGFDKNTANTSSLQDNGESDIVSSIDVSETQYVCTRVPNPDIETDDGEEIDTLYFEEQNEFYTYNEHKAALYGFRLGADFTSFPLFLTKVFTAKQNPLAKTTKALIGSGPYIWYGDGVIKFGARLGVTGSADALTNTQGNNGANDIIDTDNLMGANGAQQANTSAISKINAKSASLSGSIIGDASAQFKYNRLTHSWDFDMFNVSLSVAGGFTATVPIPPLADAVYLSFTTKLTASVATGFSHALDYIDESGTPHYKISWNGIVLVPGLSVSVGLGVGLSTFIALEGGGSMDLSMSVMLGKMTYVGPQQEFDIMRDDATSPYTFNFTGKWVNKSASGSVTLADIYNYSYNQSLCVSETKGDKVSVIAKGSSFQLVAVKNVNGGKIRVTVTEAATGKVLKQNEVNLHADSLRPSETVFVWSLDNYTEDTELNRNYAFRVEIENISDVQDRPVVALDSMRIYNHTFRVSKTDHGTVTSSNLRLALFIKLCVIGCNFTLEPAYMSVDYLKFDAYNTDTVKESATITFGTIKKKKTINLMSARSGAADDDIALLTAEPSFRAVNEDFEEYFDLGEYATVRTKTLLMDDVDNTSQTQVISYEDSIYTFFTISTVNSDGTTGNYQLYYTKDGTVQGLVLESAYISEFNAYVDGDGSLAVAVTTNDSTVSSLKGNADETSVLTLTDGTVIDIKESADLTELTTRTCVKVAVYDDKNETFGDIYVIDGTDGNSVQENLVVAASNLDVRGRNSAPRSVAFYVVDTNTDADAEYNLNWSAFNDGTAGTSEISTGIMNSLYKGSAELHYTVKTADGYSESRKIPLDDKLQNMVKAGFKITGLDVVMADADTVCLVYSVELPYSLGTDGRTGTLKQIHYRVGQFGAEDATIFFGDTIVIDSVFDYDDKISDIYASEADIPEVYINSITGEYIDSVILGQVQLENAIMCENNTSLRDCEVEPCVFYRTNSGINYITYSSLRNVADGRATEDDTVKKIYEGTCDDYIVTTDEDGVVYLIYCSPDDTEYCDRLMIAQYNAEDELWNKPRTLTQTEAFDTEAYKNREATGSVEFADYSAFIDPDGNVSVALKSTYIPVTYEYYSDESLVSTDYSVDYSKYYDDVITDDSGNLKPVVTIPVFDPTAENARSDIYMISFEDTQTSLDVTAFDIINPIFVEDQSVYVSLMLENTGDYCIKNMDVSLYYRTPGNAVIPVATKNISGVFLSGDTYGVELGYTVTGENIPDGTVLCVSVQDKNGMRTLYDSYNTYLLNTDSDPDNDKTACYKEIYSRAELMIESTNADIGSDGILSYDVNIANIGLLKASQTAVVAFNIYSKNAEQNEYVFENTLFRFSVPASSLSAGSVVTFSDKYDVSDYLNENGEIYYTFEIETDEAQYDTENDVIEITTGQQIPDVEVEHILTASGVPVSMNGRIVRNMKLGDEITIVGDVVAKAYNVKDLRFYEVGSDCLSIDDSSADGIIRIRAVRLPENNEGIVKVLLAIADIDLYKYFYIRITNTDTVDFDMSHASEGWNLSGENYIYADNYNLISTETDGSEIKFDFVGENLRIYGDLLENGGDFELTVTDSKGETVISETVSSKADAENAGMLLYCSDMFDNDRYSVCIRASLDEGEALRLDGARFVIDLSQADTSEYAKVERADETLDAPLLSGRNRVARFTLTFSEDIALAEGADLDNLTVEFDEYETVDGMTVKTGNTVVFTASEITDNTLVFAGSLASKPGAVLRYVLKDADIPEDFIVTASNNNPVVTAIPAYGDITYTLKESGIMSVTVADDDNMPDGSVHKSVHVKFMSAPDVSRLEGTKLLYTTTDADGAERTVDFFFAAITDDPRVAVYRAESLELADEETEKLFSFSQGIVLNEDNYVLITADGDYLENDVTTVISDKTDLDIRYEKLTNDSAPRFGIVSENGTKMLTLNVGFGGTIDASSVTGNNGASVTVKETVTDDISGESVQNDITLYAFAAEDSAVVFACDVTESFSAGKTVSYELVSAAVEYAGEGQITNSLDKIAVNPHLEAAQVFAVNTDAYIVHSDVFFAEGEFAAQNNILCAQVEFSCEADEATLIGTSIKVYEYVSGYDSFATKEHILAFDSAQVTDEGHTVAVYKSETDVSMGYEETAKRFVTADALTVSDGAAVATADGTAVFMNSILNCRSTQAEKIASSSAAISLAENGDLGYNIVLEAQFDEEINLASDHRVFAVVYKESAGVTTESTLRLNSVEGNKAVFISDLPVTLTADEVSSFIADVRFTNAYNELTDSRGIAVSEYIGNVTYVADMTDKGVATSAITGFTREDDNLNVFAEIRFNETVREQSFLKSTVDADIYVEYADGEKSVFAMTLDFEKLTDENTAYYSGDAQFPADAVSAIIALGDSITVYGNNSLFNTNKTLALSTDIPDSGYADVRKLSVLDVAIVSKDLDEEIDNINDITVAVTFNGKIVTEKPEGLTLNVKFDGIEGTDTVEFSGARTLNGNTIVFVSSQDTDCADSNVITVTLEDAVIGVGEGSAVYDVNGNSVSLAVPDTSAKFVSAGGETPEDPEKPGEEPTTGKNPEETTTQKETTTVAEATTKANETTTAEKTTVASGEETTTNKAETTTVASGGASSSDKTPLTGDTQFAITASVIVLVGLAVLLAVKKRDEK